MPCRRNDHGHFRPVLPTTGTIWALFEPPRTARHCADKRALCRGLNFNHYRTETTLEPVLWDPGVTAALKRPGFSITKIRISVPS
jgi:hypothetical protein